MEEATLHIYFVFGMRVLRHPGERLSNPRKVESVTHFQILKTFTLSWKLERASKNIRRMKMKNKRIFVIVFTAVIVMVLASGVSAQSFTPFQEQVNTPAMNTQPGNVLSVAAQVSEAISYQGVLEENGIPVTGSRDMTFRLYSDDACTNLASGIVDISDVPVDNGHFSVQLDFDPSVFTGQALFLEVQVESTAIACQEILAVPYALSLRPGAKTATDSTEDEAAAFTGEVSSTAPGGTSTGLRGINHGTGENGIGVHGSQAGDGWGVYGYVDGDGRGVFGSANGDGSGIYGSVNGAEGYGVYGFHRSTTGFTPGVHGRTASQDMYAKGVEGVVISTSPGSFSAGVAGINKGTGDTGIGVSGTQDGSGWGVYGQVDGNGIGIYGKADGATGIGVYAQGGSASGTALMLSNGGIRVNNAGLGTSTPVFIHQATASNITCGFSQCTMIDHPLTNSDPNAILIVTQNFNYDTITSAVNNPHPVGVQYLSTPAKWAVYNVDLVAMTDGAVFNILVVKP
jgi:hypothetical protein